MLAYGLLIAEIVMMLHQTVEQGSSDAFSTPSGQ
jgi:hypothetical protein